MDYEALAKVLPVPVQCWNNQEVAAWLNFIHLPILLFPFNSQRIDGKTLLSLNEHKLEGLGVKNNIIKRKLVRWIKEGLPQFEQYLIQKSNQNKENIPPLQRKGTTQRGINKLKPSRPFRHSEESMVIRSCDGSLASYFVMKDKAFKIGRSHLNVMRSLEASVANQHAEIMRMNGQHYLADKGTEAGTFIKIVHPRLLKVGTLIEMGSFLMEVKDINRQMNSLLLKINHMLSQGTCEVVVTLTDGCSFYSFGRRKTNNFYADDEHLSGIHAKIYHQQGQFFMEDMHSTNGYFQSYHRTWLRLSHSNVHSEPFLLEEGAIFKVGTTVTYQCSAPEAKEEKMQIQYDNSCLSCDKEPRNVLFLPCKHNAVCLDCSNNTAVCPLCSGVINERIKIYL